MVIPNIFHRIWLGPNPIPTRSEIFWEEIQSLHPDWEFKTWREEDLDWLLNRRTFDESPSYSEKSDVARFEILLTKGGIYVDTDVQGLKPVDDAIRKYPAFAGWEYSNKLGTAVLGAQPGHEAIRRLVDRLPQWADEHEGQRPDQRTGPLFLTTCWWRLNGVARFPRNYFYPVGWFEENKEEKLRGPFPKESYFVHHWDASWVAQNDDS